MNVVKMNETRCRRLISQAVSKLNLDLSGMVVLTEAATGYYMLTPLIAALAGADRVLALTQDSCYGTAQDVSEITLALAERWGIKKQIEVLFSRNDGRIATADIVTNLGFVRPLDAAFMERLKRTCVIPLMFETWEYRSEDLDLTECRCLGIPVLGTNEHHPSLQIFQYVGPLVLKLLFELDIEVFQSRVVVVGGGEFGNSVVNSLKNAGAVVSQIRPASRESLNHQHHRDFLANCDAIVIVEHRIRKKLIGPGGQITSRRLFLLNPGIVLIHIAGNVDHADLKAEGVLIYPFRLASVGSMSVATDYVGPRPLIDLHTAGLKVGEEMARARLASSSYEDIYRKALKNPICQDFTKEQKIKYSINS